MASSLFDTLLCIFLGLFFLGTVGHHYWTKSYDIQSTQWRRSTCKFGATRITKEKKVRSCGEGSCDYYYCYTPEVEVQHEGSSEKVWAKEFHKDSDEDCWLYKPLAKRYISVNDLDEGGERGCFVDSSDPNHVKLNPKRAPIHWWTWLWYVCMGGLGAFILYFGICDLMGWDGCRFCHACCLRTPDREPLLGHDPPASACTAANCDIAIVSYRALWFLIVLAVGLWGPSRWHGSHPGITSTDEEFQRTWYKWADGDEEFLDQIITHCDTLFRWTVYGICTAEATSLLVCALRMFLIHREAPMTLGAAWVWLIDFSFGDIEKEHAGFSSLAAFIFTVLVGCFSLMARWVVINGLLNWGDEFGGLSSYFADSRNNIVFCCDPTVLYISVTWVAANVTTYLLGPCIFAYTIAKRA